MKPIWKVLFLVALVVPAMTGCQEKDKRERISSRGRGYSRYDGRTARAYYGNNQNWTGVIIGSPDNLFEDATKAFLSVEVDPREVGRISGQAGARTGVRFRGFVRTDQRFDPRSNYGDMRVSDGELDILIWDSYAEQDREEGFNPVLRLVDYRMGGRSATLTFEDGGGTVTLDGTFDDRYFYGEIWFDNEDGESWTWGTFYVPVCDFFDCRG